VLCGSVPPVVVMVVAVLAHALGGESPSISIYPLLPIGLSIRSFTRLAISSSVTAATCFMNRFVICSFFFSFALFNRSAAERSAMIPP